jgi:hypothetical protein
MDRVAKLQKDKIQELHLLCPYRKMRVTDTGQLVSEEKSCKYPKFRDRIDCVIMIAPFQCPLVKEIV